MGAYLHNISSAPLVLRSVSLRGRHVDSVLKVIRIAAAPFDGKHPERFNFAPGGIFKLSPPALLAPGRTRCNVQKLVPLSGFVLPPGGEARVMVELEAKAAGDFRITDHVVTYEQRGQTYEQLLPIGLSGSVTPDSNPMKPTKAERPCESRATVLP